MQGGQENQAQANYSEKLCWPIWFWLIQIFFAGTIAFSVWVALGETNTTIVAVFLLLALVIWSHSSVMKIHIDQRLDILQIDGAQIPLSFITDVVTLDKSEMSIARTSGADLSAHLALRFWVKTGVKISISDERDPTKSWLISSKRGEEFRRALMRNLYT